MISLRRTSPSDQQIPVKFPKRKSLFCLVELVCFGIDLSNRYCSIDKVFLYEELIIKKVQFQLNSITLIGFCFTLHTNGYMCNVMSVVCLFVCLSFLRFQKIIICMKLGYVVFGLFQPTYWHVCVRGETELNVGLGDRRM